MTQLSIIPKQEPNPPTVQILKLAPEQRQETNSAVTLHNPGHISRGKGEESQPSTERTQPSTANPVLDKNTKKAQVLDLKSAPGPSKHSSVRIQDEALITLPQDMELEQILTSHY